MVLGGVKVGDRVAGTFFEGWACGRLTERDMATARGGATQGMLAEYILSSAEALVRMEPPAFGPVAGGFYRRRIGLAAVLI
jgi:NADPH:quinone reductase-like Zn-dependent oxidoreductase